MRRLIVIGIAFLASLASGAAYSGESDHKPDSAICISLNVRSEWERLAYWNFSKHICGDHYRRNLVIVREPGKKRTPLDPLQIEEIRNFLAVAEKVDLFAFGHTNHIDRWFVDEFRDELRNRLRFVYNSGCDDGMDRAAARWLEVADSFVGHREENWGIKFTPVFLERWLREGDTLHEAVSYANALLDRQIYYRKGNDPKGYVFGNPLLEF